MSDIRFAQPLAFLLLAMVAVAIWMAVGRRRRARPQLTFPSIGLVGRRRTTLKLRLRWMPRALMIVALTLTIVAFARPQSPLPSDRSRNIEGIDIMLVCDVSESMRALDFKPNRLRKAREVMREFVAGREDDQIGVVIFGKDTFVLCPLTHDYSALETFIGRIDFDLVNGRGTAIGMGLANGVNKLRVSPAKSKVLILLTDGENNQGRIDPLTAANIAKEFKIRVYTIGVGSKGLIDMPVPNARGLGFQTQRYRSNINTEELREIADMTGGQFFEATSGKKLEEIFAQIDKMEKTEIEINERNFYDELAHWLVIPAALLFGLAILLDQSWLLSFP